MVTNLHLFVKSNFAYRLAPPTFSLAKLVSAVFSVEQGRMSSFQYPTVLLSFMIVTDRISVRLGGDGP